MTTLSELKRQYKQAKVAYYNAQPIMSDAQFDRLEDKIRKLDSEWSELAKTGVKVKDKKTEAPLLKFMPSLNKMYSEDIPRFYKGKADVSRWIWMDKLDGTSLQLVYHHYKPIKLMTRGDGTMGGDISFFIPWLIKLKLIPSTISEMGTVVYRLEALMKIKTFERKWSREAKSRLGWDNIRNGVNGLFNKQQQHPALADVDLVVLGVYGKFMSPALKMAKTEGFNVVRFSVETRVPDKSWHETVLTSRRETSEYEMDGLVIAPADFVMDYKTADKPKAMIAFKSNDEDNADEVVVQEIIWQKTRLKRWIPKIKITPVKMDGVMVTHAASHNALWMKDRGIGPGALVKVLRAGGVIPKIVDVIKKAKFKEPPGPYKIKGVHFLMLEADQASNVRGIHHFMTSLGIEYLAGKTIDRLYQHGLTTAGSYIKLAAASDKVIKHTLDPAELGPKQSAKIVAELKRVLCSPVPLRSLMIASGCFEEGGMGERKLEQLTAGGISLSKLIALNEVEMRASILGVKGFKHKTADILVNGIKKFNPWLKNAERYITVDKSVQAKAKAKTSGPLSGANVAWTSYRSPEQEQVVTNNGGEVIKYGAKMTVLLYKEGAKFVAKIEKAGDKAMTWDTFVRKYKVKL